MSSPRKNEFPDGYIVEDGIAFPKAQAQESFAYSDGDAAENYLLDVISGAEDRSLFGERIRAGIRDWASLYHLSPKRANLLRPFASLLRGNVLEVGAGCGAITRYLGENGGNIVAVEASARRAKIARLRTSDLSNVQVVCDRVEQFSPNVKFDVVTSIGALKYAAVYNDDKADPHVAFLKSLRKLLSEKGVVLLAIENKLGLKYLAGAPEDHTGRAFDGINDGYREGSVATFGASELADLLNRSGLHAHAWYVPCPDYKLPTTVLSGAMLTQHADLAAILATQAAPNDPQRPADPAFSLEQAWSVLGRNYLIGELANSFLVVAGANADATKPYQQLKEIGWHYSVDRHPAFAKATTFIQVGSELVVGRHSLTTSEQPAVPIKQVLEPELFRRGTNWWNELSAIVNKPNWTIGQIADWARVWVDALLRECRIESLNGETFRQHVNGRFFDAAPFNLIRDEFGETHFFDQEWRLKPDIEFGYLVFRGLRDGLIRIRSYAPPSAGTPHAINKIIMAVFAELGVLVTRQEIDRCIQMEQQVQAWVHGRPSAELREADISNSWNVILNQRIPVDRVAQSRERQALQGDIEKLQEQLRGSEATHAKTAAELSESNSAVSRQARQIAHLTSEQEASLQRIEELGQYVKATNDLLRDSQSQTQRLAGELDGARQELLRASEQAAAEQTELAEQIAEREGTIASLQGEMETIRTTAAFQRQEASRAARERDAASRQVAQLLSEVARLQHFRSELGAAIDWDDRTESEVNGVQQEVEAVRLKLRRTEQAQKARTEELLVAKAQLEQLHKMLKSQALALSTRKEPSKNRTALMRALAHLFSSWKRPEYKGKAWEAEAIRSSRLFSAFDYLTRYPDVAESGQDPLLHFLCFGEAEARKVHELFDSKYYFEQHPEVAESGMSALAHYASMGFSAGFNPHPLFDTGWYLREYSQVVRSGTNPLYHYVSEGWKVPLNPHPLFDASYYYKNNPDVLARNENPLVHYCKFGWKEGRNPSASFDTKYYLSEHRDVSASGDNPLIHYVRYGKVEGRAIKAARG